jgi:hypothetical protein
LLEFIGGTDEPGFSLDFLETDSEWFELTFDDLPDHEKTSFFQYQLGVRMLQNASDKEIRDLFTRFNENLTPLTAQELRHATYLGPFVKLAESQASDLYWAENRIVTPEDIRRMRDVEFVSELLIGATDGPQAGNRATIDDYYRNFEEYSSVTPELDATRRLFRRTLDLIQEVLPDLKNTRWRNKSDFYSLFIALAFLLRENTLPETRTEEFRKSLDSFTTQVTSYQKDDNAPVPDPVATYVKNVVRGSTDQSNRGLRHQALIKTLGSHFRKRLAA